MAIVERGNVVLHVDDADVQHYISLGYSQTDGAGHIIKACIPNNVGELQKYYVEHLARIEQLESEVARLTSELEKKPSTKKKASVEE